MNREKMGRDKVENVKKCKSFDDAKKPNVKEKQITITNITNASYFSCVQIIGPEFIWYIFHVNIWIFFFFFVFSPNR